MAPSAQVTRWLRRIAASSCALFLACGALLAHHGSASYRTGEVLVLSQAKVTRYLWANPHAMLLFDVRETDGRITHWAGEAGSPAAIRALGWTKKSFQLGDVVTVHLYPSKFEPHVGRVDRVVLPDGTILCNSPRGDRGQVSNY